MATKRLRNGKYQYIVKNKKLLPKPLYFTFDDEVEGGVYIKDLETLLSNGVVPAELLKKEQGTKLHDLINEYIKTVSINIDREKLLTLVLKRIQNIELTLITYQWSETWIL